MAGFLAAHGYDPGPTQRPLLAGALAGVLATIPAIAVLQLFGSLEVEARILGSSVGVTLAAGWLIMALAGAVYARLFGRAATTDTAATSSSSSQRATSMSCTAVSTIAMSLV